jgi:hypothetical protein
MRYMVVSMNGTPCTRVAVCSHDFFQVEMLQEQVCDLHKKTRNQRELNNIRALQQQETLAHLSNTLTEKRSSADSAEMKLQEYSTTLDNLLHGIDHIFHIVQCDNAPILSMLGECN